MPATRIFTLDLLERAVWTFLQGFASALTVDGLDLVDLATEDKLTIAAVAGGYAVLKAFAAKAYGRTDSAALLPGEPGL